MKNFKIPLLGIHIGNLGFLNQVNAIDLKNVLNEFYSIKSYSIKTYNLLTAKLKFRDNKKNIQLIALNDIVINHANLLRVIKLKVSLDGNYLNTKKSEGEINPLSDFHGGDFQGIIQKIEEGFFSDLGISFITLDWVTIIVSILVHIL